VSAPDKIKNDEISRYSLDNGIFEVEELPDRLLLEIYLATIEPIMTHAPEK
jgi:hypothetical protein